MKRILVIEDNDLKSDQIITAVRDVTDAKILKAKSFNTALPHINHSEISLILLDMTFEVIRTRYQTASPEALAGLQVLQYMKRMGFNIPVIVITQHEEFHQPGTPAIKGIDQLDQLLKRSFPDFYIATVYMNDGIEWKSDLYNLLRGYVDG